MNLSEHMNLSRRTCLKGTGALMVVSLVPVTGHATPDEMLAAITELYGKTPIKQGRVAMKTPALAENGNSVPLTVSVESPMTDSDHVKAVHIFAEANPLPRLVSFYLGPRAGKAEISTRIRLADTQTITGVAEMSDGSLWSGTTRTVVTLAACLDLGL